MKKSGIYQFQWLDPVKMCLHANYYQNTPSGSKVKAIFTNWLWMDGHASARLFIKKFDICQFHSVLLGLINMYLQASAGHKLSNCSKRLKSYSDFHKVHKLITGGRRLWLKGTPHKSSFRMKLLRVMQLNNICFEIAQSVKHWPNRHMFSCRQILIGQWCVYRYFQWLVLYLAWSVNFRAFD